MSTTPQRPPAARLRPVAHAALAVMVLLALSGCGASGRPSTSTSSTSSVPRYVTEPFTQEQKLVEQAAPLIVEDGCATCHLIAKTGVGPSFSSFAGHRVRLRDGRSVRVDERFVREGLLHPATNELRGYDPAPMLAAIARLHFARHPQQIAALAAFIEQVGPEAE